MMLISDYETKYSDGQEIMMSDKSGQSSDRKFKFSYLNKLDVNLKPSIAVPTMTLEPELLVL